MSGRHYEYSDLAASTYRTARAIVPLVVRLIGVPERVVDLGGGTGGFLRAFRDAGATKVVCVEHPSVMHEPLLIDPEDFVLCDLEAQFPAPVAADLAISTELGEHLGVSRSGHVVDFLTRSASVVLFSAAVPGQGGYLHVNEQWPIFWARQFRQRGFAPVDAIRPRLLLRRDVDWWARQNLMMYASERALLEHRLLQRAGRLIPHWCSDVYTAVVATGLRAYGRWVASRGSVRRKPPRQIDRRG